MSDLLQTAREAAPDYPWQPDHHDSNKVTTTIGRHRWLHIKRQSNTMIVDVSHLQRETPAGDGKDTSRLYTGRCYRGGDLATLVAQAAADPLAPMTVAGVVLWPTDRTWSRSRHWTDDSGRYSFEEDDDGKCVWKCTSEVASLAARLIAGAYDGFAGRADTLPQAVADAMDAPRRFTALLEVLNAQLQLVPAIDPWTYAGVVQAKDGERAVAGPCDTLLDLKAQMNEVEKPFIGRMNTDASYIVAVPDHLSGGLDAWALIEHPAALRLKRY